MLRLALLAVCFVVLGCDSDVDMRNRHGDKRPFMVRSIDTGDCYIVEHRIGGNYAVSPIKCASTTK